MTSSDSSSIAASFAAREALSLQQLAHAAPAAFADHAAESTGPNYVFISTRDIVSALMDAGFAPTHAMQTRSRDGQAAYARHMLRFQPIVHALALDDVVPQIVLINSHDGRSAYQLRAGLFRPVCTNGLLTPIGDFGLVHVSHRGNVVRNVVDAAQQITREFGRVGEVIEEMRGMTLSGGQQLDFAREALRLRFADRAEPPLQPAQLLERRRLADLQRRAGGDPARRAVRAHGERPRDAHAGHPCHPGERAPEHRAVDARTAAHRPLTRPGPEAGSGPFVGAACAQESGPRPCCDGSGAPPICRESSACCRLRVARSRAYRAYSTSSCSAQDRCGSVAPGPGRPLPSCCAAICTSDRAGTATPARRRMWAFWSRVSMAWAGMQGVCLRMRKWICPLRSLRGDC